MLEVLVVLAVIVLMIAANALYVAGEFATVGSRRSRVQELAAGGNVPAQRLLTYLQSPKQLDAYVAACQIGITLSSLVVGAYGQAQLTPRLRNVMGDFTFAQPLSIVVILLLLTGSQVVLGELLPKTIALRYPERLALLTLWPVQLSLLLFKPLIALFNGSAFRIMRALKLQVNHSHSHVHSPEELEALFTESAQGGLIDAQEREMLRGVMHLEDRVVREVMTPRTRLVTLKSDLSVREALQQVATTPFTRFPVRNGTVDHVLGLVHVRDLYVAAGTPNRTVHDVMKPAPFVPESASLIDVWLRLNDTRQHAALVVDEYGGIAGLLTLEDALEEVFGELQDEFDQEEQPVIEHHSNLVSVRGDVLIEFLNERYDLDLPTEDADTVSGLIWAELEREPHEGDEVSIGRVTMRVEHMDRRAVNRASFVHPAIQNGDA